MPLITGTDGHDEATSTRVTPGVTGGPATTGDDTVLGLGDSDYLRGGTGNDLVDGGDGQ